MLTVILHTNVENCRHLGINLKEYLADVLTRLPAMMGKDAITLTPANWLKNLHGASDPACALTVIDVTMRGLTPETCGD